jgi:hypothetical protein
MAFIKVETRYRADLERFLVLNREAGSGVVVWLRPEQGGGCRLEIMCGPSAGVSLPLAIHEIETLIAALGKALHYHEEVPTSELTYDY